MNSPVPDPLLSACERVLARYARPVAHLRTRFLSKRLGLVCGEGVGRDLGFPAGSELLDRIARSCRVPFRTGAGDGLFRTARRLFEHFASTEYLAANPDGRITHEDVVRARWLERVHQCLYGESPTPPEDLERRTLYIHQLLPLLRAVPFSINYNFDDTFER